MIDGVFELGDSDFFRTKEHTSGLLLVRRKCAPAEVGGRGARPRAVRLDAARRGVGRFGGVDGARPPRVRHLRAAMYGAGGWSEVGGRTAGVRTRGACGSERRVACTRARGWEGALVVGERVRGASGGGGHAAGAWIAPCRRGAVGRVVVVVGDGRTAWRMRRRSLLSRAQRDAGARALTRCGAPAPCCCRRNGTAGRRRCRRPRSRGRATRKAPPCHQWDAPPSAADGGPLVRQPHRLWRPVMSCSMGVTSSCTHDRKELATLRLSSHLAHAAPVTETHRALKELSDELEHRAVRARPTSRCVLAAAWAKACACRGWQTTILRRATQFRRIPRARILFAWERSGLTAPTATWQRRPQQLLPHQSTSPPL